MGSLILRHFISYMCNEKRKWGVAAADSAVNAI